MNQDKSTWLAYNRRVDIVLEPAGQQSTQSFPNDAPDARTLWQRFEPDLQKVESAANSPINGESSRAGLMQEGTEHSSGSQLKNARQLNEGIRRTIRIRSNYCGSVRRRMWLRILRLS
jgi:hypothetical protein